MSDVTEYWKSAKARRAELRSTRRRENLDYLESNGVEWVWIDVLGDHILIDGHIDYYLAKTYWFDRTSKRHGYHMLHILLEKGTDCGTSC